jgi:hypothetical protein
MYGILKNPVKMGDKIESECKEVRVRLGLG